MQSKLGLNQTASLPKLIWNHGTEFGYTSMHCIQLNNCNTESFAKIGTQSCTIACITGVQKMARSGELVFNGWHAISIPCASPGASAVVNFTGLKA
ncbi:MAG: hypothetical protein IPQ03_07440 [Bacteroidetes bacterium]|nr:hypothetical protein [Bacteroidota bacterium]